MSEQTQVVEQEVAATPLQESPFSTNAWTESLPEQELNTNPADNTEQKTTPDQPTEQKTFDSKDFLKTEFDVEDIAVLKAEREEYKKLKETPSQTEYKFENEESKRVAEALSKGDRKTVLKILAQQDRIESLTTAEVTDENSSDIIKLAMELKYKDLTPKQIEYKFNKEFGLPKEPIKTYDELDEEFDARKSEWQEKVDDIKMNLSIEAKLARPEIEKLKSDIVLPEISKPEPIQKEPSPEEVAKFQKMVSDFKNEVDNSIKDFNDISVTFKDGEEAEITSSYTLSKEEKELVATQLKTFAEHSFDANAILADRWVNKDGSLNVSKMSRDLARLNSDEKIDQKFAQDASAKRVVSLRKEISNINVTGTSQKTFQDNGNSSISPFSTGSWSEKPPVFQN